jgi:D-alanine-D-alanine ligase
MAAYANISYSGMLAAIIGAAKKRYGIGLGGKVVLQTKAGQSTRKSPAECAAEFEEEVEAKSSIEPGNGRKRNVFSSNSETIKVL